MLTITPQYEGFYGSIEAAGKGSVQTLFYQFMGLPIFPQDTYWVEGNAMISWNLKVTELRRSVPSIVIGYLRGWSTVGSIWLLATGLFLAIVVHEPLFPGDPLFFGRTILGVVTSVIAVLGLVASIVLWIATRRALSADELARRAVFQQWTGVPCDAASLKDIWSRRDDLKRAMASIAEAMGGGKSYEHFDRWSELATRPDVPVPPDFLRMALTVARLERSEPAEKTDVAQLPAIEEAIWQRLCAMDPSARTARPS